MTDSTPRPRVVVGVDGSEPSKRALEWGRFVARAMDAPLEAVSVWHVPATAAMAAVAPLDLDLDGYTARALHATVTEVLTEEPDVPVTEVVGQGSAAQVLLERSKKARLLVVGSRGHGGFAGLMLGSVSSACAEHAQCPVLVIHGDTPPPPVVSPPR
jgi:nucleotide-binding universal stress UspA family protein